MTAAAARTATIQRKTKETEVEVTINLDGSGGYRDKMLAKGHACMLATLPCAGVCIAETPVGFLNHMLDQISSHGLFDLTVKAKGDT